MKAAPTQHLLPAPGSILSEALISSFLPGRGEQRRKLAVTGFIVTFSPHALRSGPVRGCPALMIDLKGERPMNLVRRLIAEFLGTFWLIFGGCGSAVLAAAYPQLGIGFAGVSLAFGLALLTGIYAVGHISGGHFNPAVTIGLWTGGRTRTVHVVPYIVVQVAGAILAAFLLKWIAQGRPGFELGAFAANGFGDLSPGKYNFSSVAVIEVVLTFFFVFVILGATSTPAPAGFAGLAIGLALALANLVAIPVDNASINPARSTGPALVAGAEYIKQLWLFWAAPIVGAFVAGVISRVLFIWAPPVTEAESPAIRRGRARAA